MRITLTRSLTIAIVAGMTIPIGVAPLLAAPENAETENAETESAEKGSAEKGSAEKGSAEKGTAEFAAPVRIEAGEALLGAGRMYPSPAMHDVDGDGNQDIVVGDLFGKLTYAAALLTEDGSIAWGDEVPIPNREGKDLKFHNW